MDRIKRLSYEVLDGHKTKFGEDFADNKKVLDQISIIRSKGLKNEVAGYITKFIKKEIREEKAKQTRIESSQSEEKIDLEVQPETPEQTIESEEISEHSTISEDTPIEIVTETTAETTETTAETTETTAETTETTAETTETTTETTAETTETTKE